MTRDALTDARITLLLDLRQPLAYLALRPTANLAKECGATIDYLPILDAPLKAPSEPRPDDDRGVRHRRVRAKAIAREIETYAEVQKLDLRDYYRNPDPTRFNLIWLWVRVTNADRLLEFLESIFRAYWSSDLDVEDEAALEVLTKDSGVRLEGFDDWLERTGRAAYDALQEDLRERGLARAPTTLIDAEVFVGRQHLPMIRWILEGRVGPGPI